MRGPIVISHSGASTLTAHWDDSAGPGFRNLLGLFVEIWKVKGTDTVATVD